MKTQAAGNGDASGASQTTGQAAQTGVGPLRTIDRFADLITAPVLGPGALLLVMIAAFGWGALHALSPGHGKTIVGAYLVGTRGTIHHALFLGLTTTITHTIGVFLLGLVTLFAAQFVLPEKLFPWLSLISGLLVVSIGVSLARSRLPGLWRPAAKSETTPGHAHAGGNLLHSHEGGPTHQHVAPGAGGEPVTWRSLFALGVSGGLLPCPSALVLMLGAISLQRIGLGIVLIIVFSIGLASVLTGIGILLIYAGQWFRRIPESGRLFQILPAASAVFITLVGIGITWRALLQTGVLPPG
jgi:nickel/cobalt exporter